jgi:hypothetical protein
MTRDQFKTWIQQEQALWRQLQNAAASVPPNTIGASEELTDDEIIAVMFPIVVFILKEIGLPWQFEARAYADVWRQKYRSWIDDQLDELGLHPYAVESAGTELRRQLTEETDGGLKQAWERLADLLRQADAG